MYSCANLPKRGLICQNWVVFWKFYPKSLSFTCMTWWQWRSRCWGQHPGYWPNLETIWRGHQRQYNRKRIDKLRREKYDPWKISGIPNLEEGYYGKGNIRVNKLFLRKIFGSRMKMIGLTNFFRGWREFRRRCWWHRWSAKAECGHLLPCPSLQLFVITMTMTTMVRD